MTLRFETLPPSTNHLYGRGSHGRTGYLLPKVREAKEAIRWEARSQFYGEPLQGPLQVVIELYWADRRKHDVDNTKLLLDALSDILWEDDGQIVILASSKIYDPANPRVEISVYPISAKTVPTVGKGTNWFLLPR